MLQLDDTRKAEAAQAAVTRHDAEDISAAEVAARGRELLKDEIDQQFGSFARTEVSWQKMAVMVAAIAALIIIAILMGR